MSGNPSKRSGLRVFLDSNVLVSALLSPASVASRVVMTVLDAHRLVLCDYSIYEIEQVLQRKLSKVLPIWEKFLSSLDCEIVQTPADLDLIERPYIRDAKDLPILVSALLAQPDAFISGDKDFHTPEIAVYLNVYTPREFLDLFGDR